MRVDDVVIVQDPNAVHGKWTIGRVINVYPGKDGRVCDVKLKTPTTKYQRMFIKIVVIYPAEGYEGLSLSDEDTALIGGESVKI